MKQAPYSWNMFLLLLVGKKLIISPVANRWLCSGFVLEALLIIQGNFPFCWTILMQSQGLFCLSHPPPASRLHVPSWVKDEGWRMKEEMFPVVVFVLPSHCHVWWSPAVLEVAEHWEVVNELLVLLCLHVQLLVSLLRWLIWTHETFHFHSSLPKLSDGELNKRLYGA